MTHILKKKFARIYFFIFYIFIQIVLNIILHELNWKWKRLDDRFSVSPHFKQSTKERRQIQLFFCSLNLFLHKVHALTKLGHHVDKQNLNFLKQTFVKIKNISSPSYKDL